MKRFIKLSALLFSVVILMTSVLPLESFADSTSKTTKSLYDTYDVVFLIDNSNSMERNDPNELRKVAINEFSVLTSITSEEFKYPPRIGWVFFSDENNEYPSMPLTRVDSQEALDAISEDIDDIVVSAEGASGTDINYGLQTAYDIMMDVDSLRPEGDGKCKRIIVFLSDGRPTNRYGEAITNYEDQLEKSILPKMRDADISVYTLGLGNDIDMNLLEKIASGTNAGVPSRPKDSSELKKCFREILYDAMGIRITKPDGDWTNPDENGFCWRTISIGKNSSSFTIYFNLAATVNEENMKMRYPDGQEVELVEPEVKKRRTNNAVTVKVENPEEGDWQFGYKDPDKFLGVECEFYLVTHEDPYFEIFSSAGNKSVSNQPGGVEVTFTVQCLPPKNNPNMDKDDINKLVANTDGNITVRDQDGNVYLAPVSLSENPAAPDSKIAVFRFKNAGEYTVSSEYLNANGVEKKTTNHVEVKVDPMPIQLSEAKKNIDLNSPLLGLEYNTTKIINYSDIVSGYEPGTTLQVEEIEGDWDDMCEVVCDDANQTITIKAISNGPKQNIEFDVSTDYDNVTFTAVVSIFPTWLIPLIIIASIILIAAVIFIIIMVKRPRIGGSLKISLILPSHIADKTPQETSFDLTTISRKGKVSLNAVIASNFAVAQQYNEALSAIAAFVQGIQLEAANAKSTKLWLYIPGAKGNEAIMFNNAPIEKKSKKALDLNAFSTLAYTSMNGEYRINLTLTDSGGIGPIDPDYPQGSFGGGSTVDNPFGTFGGGNDNNGGFGAFGGGNDNGGGFGAFGGGNDNSGGFGAFGGGNDSNGAFGGGNGNNGGFGTFGGGNDSNGAFGGGNDNNGGFGGF